MSLDGRVADSNDDEAILNAPDTARAKWREVVAFLTLDDPTKKGATKNKVASFPAHNTTTKATNGKFRPSALKDTASNATMLTRETFTVLLELFQPGNLTKAQQDEMVLGIGSIVPFSIASASGGKRGSTSNVPWFGVSPFSIDACAEKRS